MASALRILVPTLAGLLLALPAPAHAFWQRSHFAACAEAQNEQERLRLRCWIFAPAYEWPIGGSYGGGHGIYGEQGRSRLSGQTRQGLVFKD